MKRGIWAPIGELPDTTLPELTESCGVCGQGLRWYSVTGPSRFVVGAIGIEFVGLYFVGLCSDEMCDNGPIATAECYGWDRS